MGVVLELGVVQKSQVVVEPPLLGIVLDSVVDQRKRPVTSVASRSIGCPAVEGRPARLPAVPRARSCPTAGEHVGGSFQGHLSVEAFQVAQILPQIQANNSATMRSVSISPG